MDGQGSKGETQAKEGARRLGESLMPSGSPVDWKLMMIIVILVLDMWLNYSVLA